MTIMMLKRYAILFCLLGVLAFWAMPAAAQDTSEDAEKKKEGFWGNRFALFLEAATGAAGVEDLDTSIQSSHAYVSTNTLSFDDYAYGRAAIGWTLPHDRGSFKLMFTGYKEEGYTLNAIGAQTDLRDGSSSIDPDIPLTWWNLTISDGQLSAEMAPPIWDLTEDDANGNGIPDPDEVTYLDIPDRVSSGQTINDLQNQYNTVEILYGREFGRRRFSGMWSCGLRHFVYEGHMLAPAWLGTENTRVGAGYTEGTLLQPLVVHQDTTGIGPTGSLGLSINLFREKLRLIVEGRVAFVIQSLESDTGNFIVIARDPTHSATYPIVGRLNRQWDKDVWQVEASFAAVYTMKNGLGLELGYFVNSFHDAVAMPTDISIPGNLSQADLGVAALYNTQDLKSDGYRAGLRFQF